MQCALNFHFYGTDILHKQTKTAWMAFDFVLKHFDSETLRNVFLKISLFACQTIGPKFASLTDHNVNCDVKYQQNSF